MEDLARKKSRGALDTVLTIMEKGDSDRTRLTAALAVIERGIGKPGDMLLTPLEVEPGTPLAQQGEAILLAACRGEISPTQAGTLLGCLGNLARLVEVTELERRITALEAQKEARA